MILEVAILEVKHGLATDFEAAFKMASDIISDIQRFAYPMGTARSCKQAEAEKLFVPDCYANRCIAVVVGILSSGLYAASAQQRR